MAIEYYDVVNSENGLRVQTHDDGSATIQFILPTAEWRDGKNPSDLSLDLETDQIAALVGQLRSCLARTAAEARP